MYFLLGMEKTDRLIDEIKIEVDRATAQSRRTGKPARRLKRLKEDDAKNLELKTRRVWRFGIDKRRDQSWFHRHSLMRDECKERSLYEKIYCARDDMEKRINGKLSSAISIALRGSFLEKGVVDDGMCCCAMRRSRCATRRSPSRPAAPFVSSCSRLVPIAVSEEDKYPALRRRTIPSRPTLGLDDRGARVVHGPRRDRPGARLFSILTTSRPRRSISPRTRRDRMGVTCASCRGCCVDRRRSARRDKVAAADSRQSAQPTQF